MKKPDMLEAKKRTKSNIPVIRDEYIIPNGMKNIGLSKTYHVLTYGCQMNEHDSETIKAILSDMGYKENNIMEKADVIILNTCAIRENAHNKVFGMLGRLKHLKQERPDIIIGLAGCMSQEELVVDEILNNKKYVDIVFGTHNIHRLPLILEEYFNEKRPQIEVFSKEGEVIEGIPYNRDSKIKAWVNIMYGCDKFCTYCIVPYTRGKQRSRLKEDIISEVIDLKNNGYKEVTLLGQNVNAYGKDLYDDYNMANLLQDVANTKIDRIRFVTSHPWDFTDEMIEVIKNNDNIMPYIHLPIQSGSDRILKLMGRRYTKEDYFKLFDKLKEKIDNVSITTDVIVGFPGETEEDFRETLEVVERCKFDGAFTFIYSPREGTPAAKMEDNVSIEEKRERLQRLNKVVNKYSLENNKKYKDKKVKVLVEGPSKKEGMLMGYTDTMKLVNFKGNKDLIGNIVDVLITEAKTFTLDGIYEKV
jgi:tRNA-2-methylthio-N6-dimethylallyladenosine synthase